MGAQCLVVTQDGEQMLMVQQPPGAPSPGRAKMQVHDKARELVTSPSKAPRGTRGKLAKGGTKGKVPAYVSEIVMPRGSSWKARGGQGSPTAHVA